MSNDERIANGEGEENGVEEEPNGDNASAERRLFGDRHEEQTLFVGSDLGITRVEVASGQVGQFSLEKRCAVQDIAAADGLVLAGTDETVLVDRGDGFESIGFGPAAAVGIDGDWLYAASPEGTTSRLARSTAAEDAEHSWETVGEVVGPRKFDGGLLATDDGVVQIDETLAVLGLGTVIDVARAGPFAATEMGLYRYDDADEEWIREMEGVATAVVARSEDAHAVIDGTLFERDENGWQQLALPDGDEPWRLTYCCGLAAISDDGTLSLLTDAETSKDGQGGWRSQALGIPDPTALAALES